MTDDQRAWPPSLWAETAGPEQVCAPLSGDTQVEVAIVGAGFTGLSAALHLAETGHTVRVLEAVQPGWGASGRNGGQVNPGWKLLPEEIENLHGREQGRCINTMADAACDLVFDLIARHDMDCDAVRPGYVQGAQSRRGIGFLENWVRQWSARGAPVELLSPTRDGGTPGNRGLSASTTGSARRKHSTAALRPWSRQCRHGGRGAGSR